MNYYSIPLKLDEVMRGRRLEDDTDIRLSIHQNIRLILKSFPLSYRFDPSFGSVLNKFHARMPGQRKLERIWRERIREDIQKNIKDMLLRYETRITVKDVFVDILKLEIRENNPVVQVKIEVSGNLTLGRKEYFHYPDSEIADEAQDVFPLLIPIGTK